MCVTPASTDNWKRSLLLSRSSDWFAAGFASIPTKTERTAASSDAGNANRIADAKTVESLMAVVSYGVADRASFF